MAYVMVGGDWDWYQGSTSRKSCSCWL